MRGFSAGRWSCACSPRIRPNSVSTALTGPSPHEFTQVRGFRELADGRGLISDRLDEKLVVADFTAGTVQVIGRTGAGPR